MRSRWLYHVRRTEDERARHPPTEPYAPESLAREGFVHASFREAVAESGRLYFPPGVSLEVLQIDPRLLPGRVELVDTPRGPMPHIHGPIPREAIAAVLPLSAFLQSGGPPDAVEEGASADRRFWMMFAVFAVLSWGVLRWRGLPMVLVPETGVAIAFALAGLVRRLRG